MAKSKKKGVSKGVGVAALLLNILVFPGLGSLVGGKVGAGLTQIILMILGIVFTFTIIGAIIGAPLMLVAWIWGLATGINLLTHSK